MGRETTLKSEKRKNNSESNNQKHRTRYVLGLLRELWRKKVFKREGKDLLVRDAAKKVLSLVVRGKRGGG